MYMVMVNKGEYNSKSILNAGLNRFRPIDPCRQEHQSSAQFFTFVYNGDD